MKTPGNFLRIVRIVLAAVVFAGFLSVMLLSLPGKELFLTQAGSGLLAVLANFSAGAAAALAGILILTLFCGRVYCSVLCPLGILQDLFSIVPRKKYKYTPWKRKVRGPVFFLTAGIALCGILLPLTLLIPSSNFVIIMQYAVRTFLRLIQRTVQDLPELQTIRVMPQVQFTAWALFLILLALCQWKGRIFCNTLCPVGAVLAPIAKKAVWKIMIDPEKCVSCGACEKVCKSTCINARNKSVDPDECVMCMNCLSVCGKGAVSIWKMPAEKPAFQPDRRAFLGNAGALAGGILAGSALKFVRQEKVPGTIPAMPPGAGTRERFASRCVGCGLCISACKGKTLRPALTEYGLSGFLQPMLDPYRGACEFSCNTCSQVCPCGALTPLTLAEKQSTRIGLAHWFKDRCVAYVDEEACGACAEHCPVGAIDMVPYKDTRIPKVNETLCIGCGACQCICPVRPEAAIVVTGAEKQIRVKKPESASAVKLKAEDDFPF